MPHRRTIALLLTLLAAAGCGGADPPETYRRAPVGTVVAESRLGYAATVSRLDSVLHAANPIGVVAHIDHAARAEQAGAALRPTHVVLFGNPRLGTPLMQRNPLVGLDLPQKMLVYETPDGRAMLVYNSVDYLARRHGLGAVETLPEIAQALQRLAAQATDSTVTPTDSLAVEGGDGVVEVGSAHSVDATFERLVAAVEGRAPLSVEATFDHAANAERVGLALPPTKVLAFGHPQMTAPLIEDAPTLALDLPLKMLVYRAADGTTRIAYNDPFFLARRHALSDQRSRLRVLHDTLTRLAATAAGLDDPVATH